MDTRTQIPPKKITYMNACERFARDPSAATVEECKIARVSTRPEPHRTWRAIAGVEEIDTCCAAFWLLIAMIIALFLLLRCALGSSRKGRNKTSQTIVVSLSAHVTWSFLHLGPLGRMGEAFFQGGMRANGALLENERSEFSRCNSKVDRYLVFERKRERGTAFSSVDRVRAHTH